MFTLDQARARMRRAATIVETAEAGAGPQTAADAIAALDASDQGPQGEQPTQDEAAAEDDEPDPEGADELGDKGKQALERMKERLKAERAKNRELERKQRESLATDDAERVRQEAEQAAMEKANARIVAAEIRAAATGRLADPTDALTFIDPKHFEVDDDGSVDQAEIADAIADLITKKPYLAAQSGPKTPKADPSQGAVGGGASTAADRFAAQFGNLI